MTNKITSLTFTLTAVLAAVSMLTPLAIDMYLPAMPIITGELNTTPEQVQLSLSLYTLGFAFGQLLWGPVSDSYGRRKLILYGVLLFALTALFCSMVESVVTLNALRAIQGFAGASAAVVIQAVVKDMLSKENFSKAMSTIVLSMTIAPLAAPFIGGYLAIWFGWRSIFLALVLFSAAVLVLVWIFLPETLPREKRQPLKIKQSGSQYISLLKDKVSIRLILIGAFSFSAMFCFLTSCSFVLTETFGIDTQHIGNYFAMNIIGLMVFTSINRRFVARLGVRKMLMLGTFFTFIGAVILILHLIFDGGVLTMMAGSLFIIGSSSMIGSNTAAILFERNQNIIGTTSALNGALRFGLGSLCGTASTYISNDHHVSLVMGVIICALIVTIMPHTFDLKSAASD